MNNSLEQVIQITVLITFIASIICFFVKLGEYKGLINNDILTLKKDVEENKVGIKELHTDFEKLKNESNQNTTRFESLLMEVKVKLDVLMNVTGILKNKDNE